MGELNFVELVSGPPLLVLHGGKLDHRHMVDAVEPVFTDLDGWRRVYLDLPDLLEALPLAVTSRAERLVIQNAELIEKIRETKVPAAELHDADLEARVAESFLFSFHNEMLASRFDRPSLILSGRQDSISGYADTLAMLECYPRATYGLLDTAGHSLSWERPELFNALVRDWLSRMRQDV